MQSSWRGRHIGFKNVSKIHPNFVRCFLFYIEDFWSPLSKQSYSKFWLKSIFKLTTNETVALAPNDVARRLRVVSWIFHVVRAKVSFHCSHRVQMYSKRPQYVYILDQYLRNFATRFLPILMNLFNQLQRIFSVWKLWPMIVLLFQSNKSRTASKEI